MLHPFPIFPPHIDAPNVSQCNMYGPIISRRGFKQGNFVVCFKKEKLSEDFGRASSVYIPSQGRACSHSSSRMEMTILDRFLRFVIPGMKMECVRQLLSFSLLALATRQNLHMMCFFLSELSEYFMLHPISHRIPWSSYCYDPT